MYHSQSKRALLYRVADGRKITIVVEEMWMAISKSRKTAFVNEYNGSRKELFTSLDVFSCPQCGFVAESSVPDGFTISEVANRDIYGSKVARTDGYASERHFWRQMR